MTTVSGAISFPQTSEAQEAAQNTAFLASLNAALSGGVAFNDPTIPGLGCDVNLFWDKVKRQLDISGGTTDPAFVVSGGQEATYGAELLTNPGFATNANGWTLNSAAVWNAAGDVRLYGGRALTVAVGTSGGTGYTVGDILTVTNVTGSGLTVTVATLNVTAVATVTITTNGRQYAVANNYATTGGTGTGCQINVLTVGYGSITQTVLVTIGQTYRFVPVLTPADGSQYVTVTCTDTLYDYPFSGSFAVNYETICFKAATASHVTTITPYSLTDMTKYIRVNSLSLKQVTAVWGLNQKTLGASGNTLTGIRNGDETQYNNFVGVNAGATFADGKYNWGYGTNALKELRGSYDNTAFGANALNAITWHYGNTAVGAHAAAGGLLGIEVVAVGQYALYGGTGNNHYIVALGQQAGRACVSSSPSIFIGKDAGASCNGYNNIIICPSSGTSITGNNLFVMSPGYGNNYFLYGSHDGSSTTGYLNLRGDFNPSTADTYELGADGTEWNKAWINEVKAVTKFGLAIAPIAPRAHVADATDAASVITRCNAILASLEAFGFHLAS